MRATIAGLRWDITSPSCYRLAEPETTAATVDVAFLGDRWFLFLEHNNRVCTQSFANRDDALAQVVRAFQNVGLL